ncbi:MAG: four helix bundle protein [Candidatus Neomarinimicrobiota bacterium]|nr:MAG: four helix bundle protein [Candidatus Neomarinimicrobiota bacterium]
MYSFEKLDVWERSNSLVDKIYNLVSNFPKDERFCLTSQLKCAALSSSNNIAERSGRITAKDKANFTQISFGSLMECLNLIILANKRRFLTEEQYVDPGNEINNIAQLLFKLRRAQLSNPQTLNY